ncbi:MAG TPA: DUF3043 domain-containing protein [Aeromicrobium sp.]|nr:DUF3043 domain-containing protein [Aeromicrobium sp.]HKY57829.1 DUF3043 domain-containing protein [Aeromicrobium sp.]
MTKENPTPSRKEAEAARKKALKPPMTRKEQIQRDREARRLIRQRQQEAMRTGDDKFLPLRDRGPVKRFARDYVDRRRLVAEYLLPVLLFTFILTMFPQFATVGMLAWMSITLIAIVEEILVIRGLKKELARRFPGQSLKGVALYTILRTTQLRRFRLPAPQVKRFEELPEKY